MCGVFGGMGALVASITFALCVVALFSPAWQTGSAEFLGIEIDKATSTGLFLTCKDGDCSWLSVSSDQEAWFSACQALWVITSILMLIVAFACFALRSKTFSSRSQLCFSVLTCGSILAFILAIICVIIYGSKSESVFNRDENPHYDWGYYIAIVSTVGCLFTFCIFSIAIRCVRHGEL
jgi:amino acid transporter